MNKHTVIRATYRNAATGTTFVLALAEPKRGQSALQQAWSALGTVMAMTRWNEFDIRVASVQTVTVG